MEIIKLNIIPNGVTPICHASQFDIKRKIGVELFDNMDPYNLSGEETVSLSVRKPDKTIITKTLEIESGNYLEFETTEQMCAIAGENKCEIKISYDDMTIGSLNFIMQVERDPLFKGIQSESEIENLQEQVNTAVANAVRDQYDSENVIFDSEPTLNHGIPYAVTSDGIKRALNQKADRSDLTADNISFDNTDSGLSAINVDEAIKELKQDIPEIPSSYEASDITYDNTDSGLSANNAQEAIDELKTDIDDIGEVTTFNNLNTDNKTLVGAINELESGGGGGNARTIECTQAQYDAWKNAGELQLETTYIITDALNLNGSASDLAYSNTSSGLTADNVQEAIDEVNTNKANTIDVYTKTQTDTLLDGKTNKSLCQEGTFSSSAPFTVWGVGNYSTLIVIGMAQGVGSIALVVKVVNNVHTVYDMLTGQTFSSANLTFAYNSTNKYLNIVSNQTSLSRVTVIKGGLT